MPPEEKQIILTRSTVPPQLIQLWLQHLRDFDTAHPGCHFEIMLEDSGITLTEVLQKLLVTPGLTFSEVVLRKRKADPD
jgi:hypothetical protein